MLIILLSGFSCMMSDLIFEIELIVSWLGRLRNVKDSKEFILLCTFCDTYWLFCRAFLFEHVPCGFVQRRRQRDIRNFPPLAP